MAKSKKKAKIKVCVFCGASDDTPAIFREMAYNIGKMLAKNNMALVYGGAKTGLMGATADGCLDAGGEVIGIFPEILKGKEAEHPHLSLLIQTKTMHERKMEMYERSDAFIILPGGIGTMDEFFEILTWKALGGHNKPIFIFNFMDYWERLLKLLTSMVRHGLARSSVSSLFKIAESEEEMQKMVKKLKSK